MALTSPFLGPGWGWCLLPQKPVLGELLLDSSRKPVLTRGEGQREAERRRWSCVDLVRSSAGPV